MLSLLLHRANSGMPKKREQGYGTPNELAGRPAKMAAAQQVQMEVENGLPSAAAVVNYGTKAKRQAAFLGNLCGHKLELAQKHLILRRGFLQGREMFARA